MADDDIREPDPDPTENRNKGVATGALFAVIVIGLVLLGTVIYTAAKQNDPAVTTCSTTCAGFTRWECPGARFMGGCLGVSVCDQPVHACGTNPP
jgi:hypothetical protein